MFKKKRPLCETSDCAEFLPEDPAVIVMGEHEFKVCDSCARVIELLQEKFDDREDYESV